MSSKLDKDIQTMANLLKQGAVLTELSCPACSSPLLRLKSGQLWCAKCQKRVIVTKDGEASAISSPVFLNGLESTIMTKINEIEKEIRAEKDLQELHRYGALLSTLLENLERIRKMKRK